VPKTAKKYRLFYYKNHLNQLFCRLFCSKMRLKKATISRKKSPTTQSPNYNTKKSLKFCVQEANGHCGGVRWAAFRGVPAGMPRVPPPRAGDCGDRPSLGQHAPHHRR
jgi:hypothetical protein